MIFLFGVTKRPLVDWVLKPDCTDASKNLERSGLARSLNFEGCLLLLLDTLIWMPSLVLRVLIAICSGRIILQQRYTAAIIRSILLLEASNLLIALFAFVSVGRATVLMTLGCRASIAVTLIRLVSCIVANMVVKVSIVTTCVRILAWLTFCNARAVFLLHKGFQLGVFLFKITDLRRERGFHLRETWF